MSGPAPQTTAIRYLSLADTERLDIRMAEVVPVVEAALRIVAEGKAATAPRVRLLYPPLAEGSSGEGRPWLRDMRITPGALEGVGYAVRVGTALRRSGGGVLLLLFDWGTMELKALISDHLVHAVRSTAPNGVFAKHLALEEASVLGLIGSGRLARWAAEAVCAVRPIREVRVWSPTPAHRADCVSYLRSRAAPGLHVEEAPSAEAAVRGAHVVVAATNAVAPVVRAEWLDSGCTVISNAPEELDVETVRRSRVVTTYREGILEHVPPFRGLAELLRATGRPASDLVTDLGDVLAGRAAGRTSPDELIACLNPAYGILDVATAAYVHDKAVALGIGMDLTP